ncbi:NAD(P)-dependent dehydrogenase (short-subunit alcohol dehydrogenase family) [Mycolicibacterium sp. BK556]|uniref:SDR family NAD(P)-dependent oxidoreductase n=1 Tax=Mycobacteriaceae TaxID=1762 RepID=UPI00105F8C92|nr:SDR family oxidoreductase [Mycobacterium sp. BK086]MBB3604419.1 NAD(P)-dependent dehydrogenase (short-subunit alcohol dehydrogenase family) [Mycolicibacterium sp. BK556]MBB3634868.1 NAD(P)-dependent dehydrogenase (short-subunit alcohol dehydrogenase family) [Mycolicibacterium sp. BK607]MBB3752737.1 NAD(P)-dependent dehydrogenase (short-subunit alcohol dehydrogenase family) [Mycolicibacterium sp. BK634]TDO17326.1 NAD(P)-dependent dehydrogenase (short-subunit alcohol dehydrogenase family) [Myc
MASPLDGKVAVVTGTSRGVGLGIAHELLRAGATVIGCSRGPLDAIPGVDDPEWLARSSQRVCDQGDHRAIDAFVDAVVADYGRIDILVNNAGGTVPAPHVEDIPELVSRIQGAPAADDDYERTVLFHAFAIQMNLISPMWFAIRAYRQMREQDGVGSIVNISSGAGHPAGSPTLVSYGAAKSGLNHLTRSLAEEWGPKVRVNCLALGPTMTDNFKSFVLPKDDPTGEKYFHAVPMHRAGEPAEVGRAVVFLCSGTADFINGTTIEIDGGMMPGVLYEAGLKTITDLL